LFVVFGVLFAFSRRTVRASGRFELFYRTYLLYPAWLALALPGSPVTSPAPAPSSTCAFTPNSFELPARSAARSAGTAQNPSAKGVPADFFPTSCGACLFDDGKTRLPQLLGSA
jgi:hypothetical protein